MQIVFLLFCLFIIQIEGIIFTNNFLKLKNNNLNNNNLYNDMKEDKVYLHKIENNECGQCKLNRLFSKPAKAFTKLNDGDCKSVGYTIPNGKEIINVPVIGKIEIEKFIKLKKKINDKLKKKNIKNQKDD